MSKSSLMKAPEASVFYHGTSAAPFGRFSLGHALEGDGKCKFGYGVYVTESYESARLYAVKSKAGGDCLVYTVEIPARTADNWIAFGEPVPTPVLARARKSLGADIPAKVAADGKEFRIFLACRLGGTKKPTFDGEKKASAFLDGIGVDFIIWPFNWKKGPDGRFLPPFNRAVLDADKVRIVSADRLDRDAASAKKPKTVVVETIAAKDLPQG